MSYYYYMPLVWRIFVVQAQSNRRARPCGHAQLPCAAMPLVPLRPRPGLKMSRWQMAIIFLAWKSDWALAALKRTEDENVRLAAHMGRQASSIWMMRKADLVQVAVTELKWSQTQAEKARVGELRLAIKEFRQLQEVQEGIDPLAQRPKGLVKMLKEDLIKEMKIRQLDVTDATREVMIRAIERDVKSRNPEALGEDSTTSGPKAEVPAPTDLPARKPPVVHLPVMDEFMVVDAGTAVSTPPCEVQPF